ncbi:hypothetical protein ACH6EH_07315 [Paenibacillus sp. JSM ZJ436]
MKEYTMLHKETGARVQCSEKYVFRWIAEGFEVEEIKLDVKDDPVEEEE